MHFAKLLPHPRADHNKYSRGFVHLIGGSALYPGAAALAAGASQRMGTGYTQVWCSPDSVHDVRSGHSSLVVRPWEASQLANALARERARKAAILIGPGFGTDAQEEAALVHIALDAWLPTVIDGGALGILAEAYRSGTFATRSAEQEERSDASHSACDTSHNARNTGKHPQHGSNKSRPLILTPHAGEAARLCEAAGIHATDQEAIAAQLAEAYDAVVVLKGPVTVISDATKRAIMDQGGPELAKAGTGDVLAGMICALLAQGLAAFDAAALGCLLHAMAGRAAARSLTDISVIPEDVVAAIPTAILELESTEAAR